MLIIAENNYKYLDMQILLYTFANEIETVLVYVFNFFPKSFKTLCKDK